MSYEGSRALRRRDSTFVTCLGEEHSVAFVFNVLHIFLGSLEGAGLHELIIHLYLAPEDSRRAKIRLGLAWAHGASAEGSAGGQQAFEVL